MTIAQAIQNAQQKVADAYTAISNKGGTLPATQDLANMPTAIGSIDTVNNNTLTVTPTTSQQTFNVSGGYTGYNPVTVDAVTSSIDANISAGNIKSGVSILGVSGTVTELNGSSRSVTLTSSSGQTFNPETGKNAITSITVTPNNQARTLTATTSQQTFTVGSGYSGNGTITLNAVTSAIDSDIKATNIKSGVNILGVNGSVVELAGETRTVSITSTSGNTFTPTSGKNGITSITVTPTNQNRTVTPSTSQQTLSVNSGYSGNGTITVNAVTSSIDADIIPSNIKKNVIILGVTGTYEGESSLITDISKANYLVKDDYSVELLKRSTYTLPFNQTTLSNTLWNAYQYDTHIKILNLSSLTTVNAMYAFNNAFLNCSNLTSVDLSSLTTVSGDSNFATAFAGCTSLTSVDLSSLTTVNGTGAFQSAFRSCTSLTSVDLSSLTNINGNSGLLQIFLVCSSLTSIDLSSLTNINVTQALKSAFRGCTSLTTLSFPALTSSSFGSYTNQFNDMLGYGVTGCTVHFPSNLQSVIGSWSDVTAGFGGTNTTVLFDLPATT